MPGWSIVKKGLEIGMFAVDLSTLKADLAETPIPGVSYEAEKAKGPSAATKERAEKYAKTAEKAVGIGTNLAKTVIDTKKQQEAAKAARGEAEAMTALGLSRVKDWADGIRAAREQESKVKGWLGVAYREKHSAGGLKAAVVAKLGPIPEVDPSHVEQLNARYEFQLYKSKFGGPKGPAKYVHHIRDYYVWGEEYSQGWEIEGLPSKYLRDRIMQLGGVYSQEGLAALLELERTEKRQKIRGDRRFD